jgi:ankyrin repeat protein
MVSLGDMVRRRWSGIASGIALMAWGACRPPAPAVAWSAASPRGQVPFAILPGLAYGHPGDPAQSGPLAILVTSPRQWAELFPPGAGPSATSLDFSRQCGFILTAGTQGTTGYGIALASIVTDGQTGTWFSVELLVPGPGQSVGEALTLPSQVVRVERRELPRPFYFQTREGGFAPTTLVREDPASPALDPPGGPPLLAAVRRGELSTVRARLDQGDALGATDAFGNTALILSPSYAMTRLLLDRGADPRAANWMGVTALSRAVERGDLRAVELLLRGGAPPEPARSPSGRSPLHEAIARADLPMARALLRQGANPDRRDAQGWTALARALALGQPALIRLLLDAGADPRTTTPGEGQTGLHTAALAGDPRQAAWFLAAKVPLDLRDGHGRTPLFLATMTGHAKVVAWLLERGADPNIPDENGETPLIVSGKYLDPDAAEALLRHGARAGHRNRAGKTARDFVEEQRGAFAAAGAGDPGLRDRLDRLIRLFAPGTAPSSVPGPAR